jgi:AcrR family transcriptional regulator
VSRSEFEIRGRRSDSARAKGRITMTRADVIQAGAGLLDKDGVEQFSMRKLAKSLGTGPATLYWHVHDKNELLRLILDDSFRQVVLPDKGSWDERLTQAMLATHDALQPRPALVEVLWGAGWELGPETLRVADGLIALVAESGLPEREVADAYLGLITLLFGFVAGEGSSRENPSYRDAREGEMPASDGPSTPELYPSLVRYGPDARLESMQRRFRYALDRLIAGIKVRVAELEAHEAGKRRRKRGN